MFRGDVLRWGGWKLEEGCLEVTAIRDGFEVFGRTWKRLKRNMEVLYMEVVVGGTLDG